MELDIQSLFGLHVHSRTHWLRLRTPLPHLGPFTRALLVSQDKNYISLWPPGGKLFGILQGVQLVVFACPALLSWGEHFFKELLKEKSDYSKVDHTSKRELYVSWTNLFRLRREPAGLCLAEKNTACKNLILKEPHSFTNRIMLLTNLCYACVTVPFIFLITSHRKPGFVHIRMAERSKVLQFHLKKAESTAHKKNPLRIKEKES